MKKIATRLLLVFALLAFISSDAAAQIEVRIRPNAPVMRARPVPPSRRHVWIDGGWVYRGNGYVWSNGYWIVPRPGMVWIAGSWRRSHRGYIWVPGQWRRRY